VLKTFGAALLLASGLAITTTPAPALEMVVAQVDKNTDGSMTYHFILKTDPGETLTPGESKATADFVTVYNFYGMVDGSAKSPAGWEFSSEEFGRTPTWNGYPVVLPLDVPNTPNLTWTVTKPVAAGTQTTATATTRWARWCRVNTRRRYAPIACIKRRRCWWNAKCHGKASKQAVISALPTPSFPRGELTSTS
jgi:hypothetical protein